MDNLNIIDLDQMAQPLVQSALHQKLGGCGHFAAVGLEKGLQKAAAEVRPVDAFAGVGKQKLLDQLADVAVFVGSSRLALIIELET